MQKFEYPYEKTFIAEVALLSQFLGEFLIKINDKASVTSA
jgi:hypothetical protein